MCGICGVIHFSDEPVVIDPVRRACAALRHRGPDHADVWVNADPGRPAALGATRLAVLDPRPRSNQPMHGNSGRYHLVFNGEIYNFRSIRRQLLEAGEKLITEGDTEVVLAACARWGAEALARFNGMFALAFYDSETHRGFIARDRFGIKPLFYSRGSGAFTFASELAALRLLEGVDTNIDSHAVAEHLLFGFIAQPRTIYQGARRLKPGCLLTFDEKGANGETRYYMESVRSASVRDSADCGDARLRLRRRLSDAVVARRISDAPIGAFLSGGLDSSIIVLHLAEALGEPVKTFAVGYAGQSSYDETAYARMVADALGTEHHELVLSSTDVLDAIPRILDHLGEPVGDSSIVPTALVSEFAREFVTVALSGDGSDELFGGYWRYLGHNALRAYEWLPRLVRSLLVEPLLAALGSAKSSSIGNRARQFRKLVRTRSSDPLARHLAWSRIMAPEAEKLFTNRGDIERCEEAILKIARETKNGAHGTCSLNNILRFDRQHILPADMLQKVDLASMMHSLEVRVPFLDHHFVEFAESLPAEVKVDRGMRKRILIDAYRGRLPDEVLDRPKQGFEVPMGEFLRGPLREMFFDTVTRDTLQSLGPLSFDAVEDIYANHLSRRGEHADLLFALLSLCWWHRRCK